MNLIERIKQELKKIGQVFSCTPDLKAPHQCAPHQCAPHQCAPPTDNKDKDSKPKKEVTSKLLAILLVVIVILILLGGCSKNQDIKIVHNYMNRMPSIIDRKNQLHMDLQVYKTYRDINGKESIRTYRVD